MEPDTEKRLVELELWMQTFCTRDARHIELIQKLQEEVKTLKDRLETLETEREDN